MSNIESREALRDGERILYVLSEALHARAAGLPAKECTRACRDEGRPKPREEADGARVTVGLGSHAVIRSGHSELLNDLLESEGRPYQIWARDSDGNSLLHTAAEVGGAEIGVEHVDDGRRQGRGKLQTIHPALRRSSTLPRGGRTSSLGCRGGPHPSNRPFEFGVSRCC